MQNLPQAQSASMPLSPERLAHREWIGGRAVTLLSHYWRDDDPIELTSALGKDWADVLEGLPRDAIQKACIQFQRDEPKRKPTPAAIYALARNFMPRPVIVPKPAQPEVHEPRISGQRANEILAEVFFTPKRMED